jgi:putative hemolysin
VTELLVIFVLVLINGVFAGAEIAVVALRKTRLQELVEQGKGSARALLALRRHPERFLATVQVGMTVVAATAAALGGESIASRLAVRLERVPWIGDRADAVALAIVIAGVSYLSIVVGELVPKSLALRAAERYGLLIGRPLQGLAWFTTPVVWFLSASANLLLKPFGDHTTFTEARHSPAELQQLVEEATEAGTLHPDAGEIASRALELHELVAMDVMVPRQSVVMLRRDASTEALRRVLTENAHSRMPVYEDHVDNVVGYVSVKDLLAQALGGGEPALAAVIRSPWFVPESKPAVELLREMRTRRMPLAIVIDEQGVMSGIVTMEDLVEELVGEIFSEHVRDVAPLIQREPDGSVIVSGTAPVREVNRTLGVELPDEGPWTTMAGLCLGLLGRIPAAGESVEVAPGMTLEILDASPRRIRTVRIRRSAAVKRPGAAQGQVRGERQPSS